MLAKRTDNKGRVVLGRRFANQMVIVREISETEMVVKLAAIVPADEAWLHRNKRAKSAVMEGLRQAASGEIGNGPDLKAGGRLVRRIEEEAMFMARWTVKATEQYGELKRAAEQAHKSRQVTGNAKASRQEGLFKQVHECVQKLIANPRHPGLRTHEFLSLEHPWDKKQKVFEAYGQNNTPGAYRVFWCYGPRAGELTIISITSHP